MSHGDAYEYPDNLPDHAKAGTAKEAKQRGAFWSLPAKAGGFPICDWCSNTGLVAMPPKKQEPLARSAMARRKGWTPPVPKPVPRSKLSESLGVAGDTPPPLQETRAHTCPCPRGLWLLKAYRAAGREIAPAYHRPEWETGLPPGYKLEGPAFRKIIDPKRLRQLGAIAPLLGETMADVVDQKVLATGEYDDNEIPLP